MTDPHLQRHLSDDEVLLALTESASRGSAAQDHLQGCPACRRELEQAQQRLRRLGELARRHTPEPVRPFRLPRPEAARWWRGWLNPALAAGITAVLVLSLSVWWLTPPGRQTGYPRTLTAEELESDQALMAEVEQLVENAMPEPYRELAAISEVQYEWDEDLIDWIVPPIEDQS